MPLQVSQLGVWNIGTITSITNPVAVTQSGTWNIGTVTSITNPVAVTQSGAWTVAATQSGAWTVDTELSAAVALSDALGNPTTAEVGANHLLWNPANAAWERLRTPTVFKFVSGISATGQTAIWTPTAGKKFRLMGFTIWLSGNAARAAGSATVIKLQDGSTDLIGYDPFVPAAAGTTAGLDAGLNQVLPGNGYLSAAANNVLNVSLGAALTAGSVSVSAYGTEE